MSIRTAIPVLQDLFREQDKKGLSDRKIANEIDCSQNLYRSYRLGLHTPSIMRTMEIADALGYEIIARKKNVNSM